MTAERLFILGLERSKSTLALLEDIRSAASRARGATVGDRTDIERFERLCTQLESLPWEARQSLPENVTPSNSGVEEFAFLDLARDAWPETLHPEIRRQASSVVAAGHLPVVLVSALATGPTAFLERGEARSVSDVWRSEEGNEGIAAVEERFERQLRDAIAAAAAGRDVPGIAPSGISNRVLAEKLHRYSATATDEPPTDAPVVYRDGSEAMNLYPLRSVSMREAIRAVDVKLRFALLSIRHTEMDQTVDGAWLRNSEISRPRKHSQTDDLVYEISRGQLLQLTESGNRRVHIDMYQTGLQPAIVGFYRAVAHHLMQFPDTLGVQPWFFVNRGWKKGRRSPTTEAPFVRGPLWTA